jgi:hypothetical protein
MGPGAWHCDPSPTCPPLEASQDAPPPSSSFSEPLARDAQVQDTGCELGACRRAGEPEHQLSDDRARPLGLPRPGDPAAADAVSVARLRLDQGCGCMPRLSRPAGCRVLADHEARTFDPSCRPEGQPRTAPSRPPSAARPGRSARPSPRTPSVRSSLATGSSPPMARWAASRARRPAPSSRRRSSSCGARVSSSRSLARASGPSSSAARRRRPRSAQPCCALLLYLSAVYVRDPRPERISACFSG